MAVMLGGVWVGCSLRRCIYKRLGDSNTDSEIRYTQPNASEIRSEVGGLWIGCVHRRPTRVAPNKEFQLMNETGLWCFFRLAPAMSRTNWYDIVPSKIW